MEGPLFTADRAVINSHIQDFTIKLYSLVCLMFPIKSSKDKILSYAYSTKCYTTAQKIVNSIQRQFNINHQITLQTHIDLLINVSFLISDSILVLQVFSI